MGFDHLMWWMWFLCHHYTSVQASHWFFPLNTHQTFLSLSLSCHCPDWSGTHYCPPITCAKSWSENTLEIKLKSKCCFSRVYFDWKSNSVEFNLLFVCYYHLWISAKKNERQKLPLTFCEFSLIVIYIKTLHLFHVNVAVTRKLEDTIFRSVHKRMWKLELKF